MDTNFKWIARSWMLILFSTLSVWAAHPASIRVTRTEHPPRIDGFLDDAAWKNAATIEDLVQRDPQLGSPISERTVVFICYDSKHIYFAFQCFDSDVAGITAKELARDASLANDDRVQVILDTFLDRRNGYWFQIGPRGSIGDALVSENGKSFNKQWDGLWDGRARIHPDGWDAEIVIPFKTLRFRPGQSSWGLKIIRHIKRREESSYWPEANRNTFRFQISDSGLLEGLEGLDQGIGLDLRPYGLLGVDQIRSEKTDVFGDGGLDVFYQLTPGLSTALTFNTDFAETEVDSRQINLTRFPLFFPEKRDFFLDGSNYFSFGAAQQELIPFFSRRIGLSNLGNPIPIRWGGKLTGQQASWNLGMLAISDDPADRRRNFFVSRATRNLGSQSAVGMIFTKGNALGRADNYLVGADLKLASSTFQGNKNIVFSLVGLKSSTEAMAGSDAAWGMQFLYPNDFLNLGAGFLQIEENFVAGMGFVPRSDIRQSNLHGLIGPRPGRWGIRQLFFGADFDYITDLDNLLETRVVQLTPISVDFDSGDKLAVGATSQYEFLEEDFEIHPDHLIPSGEYPFWWYQASFQSAQRRDFWFSLSRRWGSFFNGDRNGTALAAGYKITVPLFLGAEFKRDSVTLPTGTFTADISRLNANLLFSPNMTLYTFLQYDNLSRTMGWQSRFYWILKPGNEIIFAWNSSWANPFVDAELSQSAARFKVNYNFRF